MTGTPVQVAVCGCGYWGKNLVRNFAALGALAAISDPEPEPAATLARDFSVPVRPWADVLADTGIPAVAIAAPAALHAQLVDEALEAGKHVFVEKPLALGVQDAEAVVAKAEDRGRTLMVGHLMRYHPAFRRLHDLIRAGELGTLHHIFSTRLNLGKVRREENILWSFAPHDISMILALMDDEPIEVSAKGATYLQDGVPDVTTTHLTFDSGRTAHILVSWLHPFKEQKLIVIGDSGMAVLDDGEPWARKLLHYPHTIEWRAGRPLPNRAEAKPVEVAEDEPLKIECRHFLDCVGGGTRPLTDGTEGVRVLRVLHAAEESMVNEMPVSPESDGMARPDFGDGVMVHGSAFIDPPVEIGKGTRIWHFSHVLKDTHIGSNCTIGQNVMIGPSVRIGNDCRIQNNVSVYQGVTLEDGVFCGPSMVFTNVVNPRAEVSRKDEFNPTLVKRGATIGANATILCGVTLGEYCFVGAGAVITKDVAPHALMAGVPAAPIGWMSHDGERLDESLVCTRSGRRYEETAHGLTEVV